MDRLLELFQTESVLTVYNTLSLLTKFLKFPLVWLTKLHSVIKNAQTLLTILWSITTLKNTAEERIPVSSAKNQWNNCSPLPQHY